MDIDESESVKDGRIVELCLDDEDIPSPARDLVTSLDVPCDTGRVTRYRSQRDAKVKGNGKEHTDAESYVVKEFFGGDHEAIKFQWAPMAGFSGRAEEFLLNPGPIAEVSSCYEAFRMFWDDAILEHIVRETNRHAAELKASGARFAKEWYDTNVHEVLILFAFWIMLSVIQMPSIKSCFSNDKLLKTTIFRKLLSQSRYWNLTRALYFVDEATRTPDSSELFCLGPVADHLNAKFKEIYIPDRNIVIDESSTLGTLSFRLKKTNSPVMFGIKTYDLCESLTGYLWSFVISPVKENNTLGALLSKNSQMVIALIGPLLGKGYRVYMNNTFTSPLLARYLKRNKTDCVGMVDKNCQNVPSGIKMATLPRRTCMARQSGDVAVLLYQHKSPIHMITTCHGTESVFFKGTPHRTAHYKLAVIADYNRYMSVVEKKDQKLELEPYIIEMTVNEVWYKKFLKRLLNVSINNSRILVEKSSTGNLGSQGYRLELVDAIVKKHLEHAPLPVNQQPISGKDLPAERLIVGHHLIVRSWVEMGNCIWCEVRRKKLKKSVYKCSQCGVALCLDKCFEIYHTKR